MEWLCGGEFHYHTKPHCFGGDWVWVLITAASCLFMVASYVVYAVQSHWASSRCSDRVAERHLRVKCYVFLVCGFIHLVSHVVTIWFPIYRALCVLFLVNGILTFVMIRKAGVYRVYGQIEKATIADDRIRKLTQEVEESSRRIVEMTERGLASNG